MDIHELQCFLILAETLNFSRAAGISNITPSALSRIIKRLEESLGTELFVRSKRSVRITESGRRFIDVAHGIVQQVEEVRAEFGRIGTELHGDLKIFATVTACHALLPKLLGPFREQNPGVEVIVHTGDAAMGIDAVLQGQADVSIVLQPETPVKRVRFHPLSHTPLGFIAPRLEEKLPPGIQELLGLHSNAWDYREFPWDSIPMILPEKGLVREIIDRYFSQRGIQPRIVSQVSGNEAIVALVNLGLGIGLVPSMVVQNSPLAHSIRFLPALTEIPPLPISMAVLETRQKHPVVRAFLDQVTQPPGQQ
ncbi:HTH-type transcriptional activator IlvY [Spirochaeta lutea]|uniref:HTH lysR-type domain-containing protein n=1 Tax=Spirochaeta lutea TaxID=1480694 RepID=A0A098QXF3_9SPIO|nr:HTH-type transcriptional activator IlvY [Spirochaeta lutea]KGE72236.1 hypothetical protein DC28_07610 [Spirochaeta lutea]